MVSINWNWYDSLVEENKWQNLPYFNEERVPRLKEFVLALFTDKKFGTIELEKELNKLHRKLDQIYRNEFENFGEMNETLKKDLDYLLGKPISRFSDLYFNSKRTHKGKEMVLQQAVTETVKAILNNNAQTIRAKQRKEEIKVEEKIIKSLKFPCTLKIKGKKMKFKTREDFDQKINYWTNPVLSKKPLSERLWNYPRLATDFQEVINE